MKKTIAMLALLGLLGNTASAELLKNFKYDGKIVINAAATNNVSDANSDAKDTTSDVSPRVEINAGFDLNDDVNAIVSAVKCDRQWNAAGQKVAAGTIDSFQMEQAYLNLKGVLGFDHKVGRQYYGNEGDLVVYYGPKNMPYAYNVATPLSVTGLDAYTGWYKTGKLDIHGILAKVANVNVAATPDADTDLVGVSAKYDLMDAVKVGAYVYEQKVYAIAAADKTTDVVGVKANGKFMGFDYYAEIAKNYGHKAAGVTYTGSALLANVKYDLEVMGKWNFMGEFASGTGDKASASKDEGFTTLNSDYRPGIIFGGVSNNSGLNNLTTWNIGAKWNPSMAEKLTLTGKFHNFATSEKVTVGANSYEAYGNELDITANWQHSENVGLLAYYGAYMVDSDFAKATLGGKDDMASTLGLAMTLKF